MNHALVCRYVWQHLERDLALATSGSSAEFDAVSAACGSKQEEQEQVEVEGVDGAAAVTGLGLAVGAFVGVVCGVWCWRRCARTCD